MNEAFAAGAEQALTKLATGVGFRAMRAAARHPIAAGALVGGGLGMAASPSDDRLRYVPHGALIGAIAGPEAFRGRAHKPRGLPRSSLSGPGTAAAVSAIV